MTVDGQETPARGDDGSPLRRALLAYVHSRARALDEARRELQIGDGDARALLHIADTPGIRPSELRDLLGITSAGVTALIDRLVDRDVARREPDAADRRVSRIHLCIDLNEKPWAQLTDFDRRFDRASAEVESSHIEEFAQCLDDLTRSALAGSRS